MQTVSTDSGVRLTVSISLLQHAVGELGKHSLILGVSVVYETDYTWLVWKNYDLMSHSRLSGDDCAKCEVV